MFYLITAISLSCYIACSFYHKLQSTSNHPSIKMSQTVLERYLWINNILFDEALRSETGDYSVFVKTFEVVQEITKRNQNFWCDVVKIAVNFTNSSNVAK